MIALYSLERELRAASDQLHDSFCNRNLNYYYLGVGNQRGGRGQSHFWQHDRTLEQRSTSTSTSYDGFGCYFWLWTTRESRGHARKCIRIRRLSGSRPTRNLGSQSSPVKTAQISVTVIFATNRDVSEYDKAISREEHDRIRKPDMCIIHDSVFTIHVDVKRHTAYLP